MVTLLFLVQSFGVQIPVGLPFLKSLLIRSAGIFLFIVMQQKRHAVGTAVVVILHRHMTDTVVLLGIGSRIDDQAKGEVMSREIENVACRLGRRILCRVTCRPHRDTVRLPHRHWKCR